MASFKAAQGRATARTVDSFGELVDIINGIDKRLGEMSKKSKEGTKAEYTFSQHFPRSYKYTPDSTHFCLYYEHGAWRVDIDSICRNTCPNRTSNYSYALTLSDSAKAEILRRYE